MGLGISFSRKKHQFSLIVNDNFLIAKLVVFPFQNQGILESGIIKEPVRVVKPYFKASAW